MRPPEDAQEISRVKRELADRLARMRAQSYYELFGVHRRATIEEIQDAEQRLLKVHNPDRAVSHVTHRDVRALAESIYLWILRAFEALSDQDTRLAYDRSLGTDDEDSRVAPLVMAEHAFERGREAEASGQLETATELFKEAADLNPNEGVYVAHFAHAAFSTSSREEAARNTAFDLFDRAVALSPRSEDVYLLRAMLHQKCGHRAEAVRDYEIALRVNPDCLAALKALKTLELPSQKKSGLLSRLTNS
jgi:tetratricopeptide (TPR) repeat protein